MLTTHPSVSEMPSRKGRSQSRWVHLALATLTMTTLSVIFAPVAIGASPSRDIHHRIAGATYCDALPKALGVGGFTCIADETIEITGPSTGGRRGGISAFQTGVIDRWHWKRSATIYMKIKDAAGNITVVGAVREGQSVSLDGRRSDTEMWLQAFTSGPIKPWLKSTCIKDNSWFPDSACETASLVAYTTWTGFTIYNRDSFYHSADDLYWYKYERKFWARDHWNPSTPDGVWLAPEGYGYVGSANFNCDKGFPNYELCRFN